MTDTHKDIPFQSKKKLGDLNSLTTAVQSHTSQLSDIATNTKSFNSIQSALDSPNQNILIPKGEHIISDTIIVPSGKQLIFSEGASLKMVNLTKHALQVKNKAKVINPRITLEAGHTGAAIYLDGADKIETDTIIENIFIRGGGSQSTGILLNADSDNEYIYFTKFKTAYIEHCGKALHLKKNNSATAYINSNTFTNFTIYQCANHFYLEGVVQANKFEDFDGQYTSSVIPSVYGLYCEGKENVFNGRFWDFKNGAIAYYFAEGSSYNSIPNNNYLNTTDVVDLGLYNMYSQIFKDRIDNKVFPPNVNQPGYSHPNGYYQLPSTYIGNQDDALAYADKRYTVTNLGLAITGGNFARLFNPHSGTVDGMYYTNPTVATPVIIEINMGATPLENVPFVGLAFAQKYIAEDFTIEIASSSGGTYGSPISVTGNKKSTYTVLFGSSGDLSTIIGKMKITITKAHSTVSVNTTKLINLRRVFAPAAIQQGMTYLPRGGGKMYGNLDMGSYYMTVGNVASLPTASATYRGQVIQVLGNGTTTADTLHICMMSATGTYSWKQIMAG